VFLDLTAGPAGPLRSRTEIRFGCREPGAATFAELTAANGPGCARRSRPRASTASCAGACCRRWRHLARALYPATLAESATLSATAAALEHGGLVSHGLRLVLLEQEAILRSVLAARSVAPRWR